jgi:phosphatidylglycerol:prolipoprotein diacylglycerol transferase
MFRDFNFQKYFPEIAKRFPNGVPDNTPLHPAPVYEFILAVIIFFILWKLRKKEWVDGKLFMYYLIFAGLERFFIEFIRLNPRYLFGLTEAQLISTVMIVGGIVGLNYFSRHKDRPKFVPVVVKKEQTAKKNK